MGRIIIEIPQNVNRTYRIASEDSAKKLLTNLERLIEKEIPAEDEEEEDILGVWTEPKKSTKEKAA